MPLRGLTMRNYEQEYAEYLMDHSEYHIGNGDMLISAMDRGNCLEDFCESVGITIEQYEASL